MAFASGSPHAGEASGWADGQDGDGGGLRAGGGRTEAAWAPRMLCCHHLPFSAGSQSWGGWETRPTQPCLAGRGGTCPHLLWASLTGPGPTTWSSALS